MRIVVVFQNGHANGERIPCYAWSYVDALMELGHEVCMWSGVGLVPFNPDLFLEIENGRNENGELRFPSTELKWSDGLRAVVLVDSHGHPDLHAEISKKFDHVFFAVWSRRDLFAGHPSAHWCPNATELKWFGAERFKHIQPEVDFGFFGSKKGLSRADDLVAICKANGWTYDVRQVANNRNPNRWPATGEAMARCRVLFNRGQKHDGPNQRVMESMAIGRPLLCDWDQRSGMSRLFGGGEHYLHYTDRQNLEAAMRVCMKEEDFMQNLARCGRAEVEAKHLVKHRAAQILEVINVRPR